MPNIQETVIFSIAVILPPKLEFVNGDLRVMMDGRQFLVAAEWSTMLVIACRMVNHPSDPAVAEGVTGCE